MTLRRLVVLPFLTYVLGDNLIKSPYYINQADFVACHNPAYVTQGMKMVQDVKPGGVFMINCQWSDEELDHHLNAE